MLYFFGGNNEGDSCGFDNLKQRLGSHPGRAPKKYNLRAGSKVVIVDYGGVLAIVPAVEDPIKKGYGFLKGGPSLSDVLKADRELEKKREERFINSRSTRAGE